MPCPYRVAMPLPGVILQYGNFMGYDTDQHHRRSLRLQGHDYASAGQYFITVCTYQRRYLFGEIMAGAMQLNPYGKIAQDCWQAIADHFPHATLNGAVIMPNHVHGIIVITAARDRNGVSPFSQEIAQTAPNRQFGQPIAGSLPTIVGSFKSATTRHINILRDAPGTPVWQRNYYEHVIRDETALHRLQRYMQNNPLSWQDDQLHPNCLSQW